MYPDPLSDLKNWLISQFGDSINIYKGVTADKICYLKMMSTKPSKDFAFLPSFHLIFTQKDAMTFLIYLVAYNGKVIDSCKMDFNVKVLSQSSLPSLVKALTDGELNLCKGFVDFSLRNVPPTVDVLADYVDEKIIVRSQYCKFVMESMETDQCSNCSQAKSEMSVFDAFDLGQYEIPNKTELVLEQLDHKELCEDNIQEDEFIIKDMPSKSRVLKKRKKKSKLQDVSKLKSESKKMVKLQDRDSPEAVRASKKTRNCVLCRKTFSNCENLKQHLIENPFCKTFAQEQNKRRLEERRKKASRKDSSSNEDSSKTFHEKCPICLDVYTVEKHYFYDKDLHERVLKDLNSPINCPICSKKIEQRRILNLHYDTEHSNNTGDWSTDKAMCCQCLSVMKRRSLKLHQRIKHEEKSHEKSFLCNVCGKQSSSKQIHELHLARKHALARDGISSPLSQVCEQCGRSYVSIDLLKQHISSMHRERQRNRCDQCNKTFYSRSALVTHRVCTHLKIFPFKCKLCQYKAGDLSAVYRHYENSHGYRGKREDVTVDMDDLKKIREICQFNYFGNINS